MGTKIPLIDSLWTDQHSGDIYKVLNTTPNKFLLQCTDDKTIFTIPDYEFNRFMVHLKPNYMTITLMPGDEDAIHYMLDHIVHNQDGIRIYDWIVQDTCYHINSDKPYIVTIDVAMSAEPIIEDYDELESGVKYRVVNRRTADSH